MTSLQQRGILILPHCAPSKSTQNLDLSCFFSCVPDLANLDLLTCPLLGGIVSWVTSSILSYPLACIISLQRQLQMDLHKKLYFHSPGIQISQYLILCSTRLVSCAKNCVKPFIPQHTHLLMHTYVGQVNHVTRTNGLELQ